MKIQNPKDLIKIANEKVNHITEASTFEAYSIIDILNTEIDNQLKTGSYELLNNFITRGKLFVTLTGKISQQVIDYIVCEFKKNNWNEVTVRSYDDSDVCDDDITYNTQWIFTYNKIDNSD